MKAKEVLRRYKEGERNFRGANLRGQSFKGKDLSGADFSEADIRSTDFTNATLQGTNFSGAKAGLQRRWAIGLVIVSWLIALFSGFFSVFPSLLFVFFFSEDSGLNKNEAIISSLIFLIIFLIFFYITIRRGLVAGISSFAVAYAVTFAADVALVVDVTQAVSGAFGITLGMALGIAFAVALSVAFAVAFAVTFNVAGFFGVAKFFGVAGFFIVAGAGAFAFLPAYISWRAFKGDERDAWIRSIAIAFAAIGGTSFRSADLTDANFTGAKLKSTDLRKAILIRTCWRDAIKLDQVRPGNSYLSNRQVQQLVITGNGQSKDFSQLLNLTGINLQGANLIDVNFQGSDLSQANLQGANLTDANLIRANLNQAQLQDADLSRAKLVQAQLEATDLTGAILTGAYIEEWGITTATILNGIQCDYVFMRLPTKENPKPFRKPDDCSKDFGEGEFVDFITPLVQTLDLYHSQDGEPRFIAYAFNKLREDNPKSELEIVSIEKRGKDRQGTLIRVETSDKADNNQLHSDYFQTYDYLNSLPPEALKALLIEKEKEIRRLGEFVGAAVNHPGIYAENYQQGDRSTSIDRGNYNENVQGNYNEQTGKFGIGSMSGGEIQDNAKVAAEINEAAAEIQQLLEQLTATYPTNTSKERNIVVGEAVDQIEANPTLKAKIINALKEGGKETFREAINHPLVNIFLATIEGWQDVE
ncbi:MAG: pentapeptide repeat-containing protein [Xenococcus sp. (in: cyanobacteria)]